MPFIGRQTELSQLRALRSKASASLVVLSGRRRIGKSALAAEFGKEFSHFYEFQGLAPRKELKNSDQLSNFAAQFREQFGLPQVVFRDWIEAFTHLGRQIGNSKSLLLLDEISWMGSSDPDFAGALKIAWDTLLKKNSKLVVLLCGSVSSWIEENILRDSEFVGRISLVLRLTELELYSCREFWGKRAERISDYEKLKLLCVTGGIPKYLEEVDPRQSVDENIQRLCFTAGGYLFEDFQRIFSDIFGKKSQRYRQILRYLTQKKLPANELADLLSVEQSGEFTRSLQDLELSGFVTRDFSFKPDGTRSKISRYRISDNYLRFYLKYIEPNEARIRRGVFQFSNVNALLNWKTIIGFQFENLILNRLPEVLAKLELKNQEILSFSPYFQTKTLRSESCQIDLLIGCKNKTYYLCELKFRETIEKGVVNEMEQKIQKLKFPRYSSLRPVLIYAGELSEEIREADYFDKLLDAATLLYR